MFEIVMKVEGMHCGMCEARVNDTVRKAAPNAKKVSSSAARGETKFLSDTDCSEAVKAAIAEQGYTVGEVTVSPHKTFSLFRK